MAKGNGRAATALPDEFLDQVTADFREEFVFAAPEILAALASGEGSQTSFSVTVAIKKKPATKRRSAYVEATLEGRVRAPREVRYYDVDLDGQGRLAFGGVLDGPAEPEPVPAAKGKGKGGEAASPAAH